MFELMNTVSQSAVIKLIGLGGGGGNAVEHMACGGLEGVEFICANTDAQALKNKSSKTNIQIGENITKGLGAGANPEIGRQAALEDEERLKEVLQGTDMLFITAGMGGGTGTGAIPVVARIAKEMGILTVAVVTKPFPFEGLKRMKVAEAGIGELREHVDSLITIPNERLLSVLGKNISLLDAFSAANDVLKNAVQGISELITRPGLINVDFADVKTVMSEMGLAMMGTGVAHGENRAVDAAEKAISSPLLDNVSLNGARGILVNVTCGLDMSIGEFDDVGNVIKQFASEDAAVVVGTAIDPDLDGELRVTVVATGLSESERMPAPPTPQPGVPARQAVPNSAAVDANKVNDGKQSARGVSAREGQQVDYQQLDTPTVIRQKNVSGSDVKVPETSNGGLEYLDIPAFLRRQAD